MKNNNQRRILRSLRNQFDFPNVQRINWYPGHMAKATREMCDKLKHIDYVIEVRDTRVPLSGVNSLFDEEVRKRNKPRLLIFNKADLVKPSQIQQIRQHVAESTSNSNNKISMLFTSAKDGTNIRNIVKEALHKYPIEKKFKSLPFMFMIAGIPNVGKSSIINALRLRNKVLNTNGEIQDGFSLRSTVSATSTKQAKKGALPGVTRTINSFVVSRNPHCLLMDTPGVLFPSLDTHEHAFKLAIINALPDELMAVGPEMLVDFLIYTMNRKQCFDYIDALHLPEPMDDIQIILEQYVCPQFKMIGPEGEPDKKKAAQYILKLFREGKLGKVVLDDLIGEPTYEQSQQIKIQPDD
jgi:ribosome biogenesis GTPase A